MFSIPAVTWTLTAVLLLSGSYHFMAAARAHRLTDRVNNGLHALMTVLMAAMLWNLAPSTMLVQIAVLGAAALWFVIQAVARPEFKLLCAGSQGRLKCVYHSLTMAAAAVMVAMMGHVTTGSHGTAPMDGMSMSGMSMGHDHHAMAAAAQSTVAVTSSHSPGLAILLTVFFGTAAVIFMILLLRFRAAKTAHRHHGTPRRTFGADHGLEAIGAAVMALMFATMVA
ncbi:DUF5134 domain-containing protein [Arthrobacter sp. ERGS1:01]|uniref:DUF5134 domain-containing protein n=1 Tax=Arthrobacter sp. ERGS1:01 TaxID=1704044 RepID=UPI0013648FBA|nr:DUF5134 domain-containing protein [Arthrobacter sp. ERGS1:01]